MTRPPTLGHNRGPALEPGAGWRGYCWRRAKADLRPARVPIEMVRVRMRRARELGLTYPQYASILAGTGRDVMAFLYTVEGLQIRLSRQLRLPPEVAAKLPEIKGAAQIAFAPSGEVPQDFAAELSQVARTPLTAHAMQPDAPGWGAARRAIRAALDPARLPSNAVVLIGGPAEQEGWAEAASMARYLPTDTFFAPS
ncbi:hypothetical protein [Pontivivens ytuae]|uniref:Uncharacterized protein n=1 Tax=Pontivivens ytuae TaxID=2789856 RepID=A0A7S9LQ61_9RHOB|nr:hypothetical protein [Pontivivens ytuae]QPH53267.1 hypothetical protein I0K15_15955 [Pontivivens ytuae]